MTFSKLMTTVAASTLIAGAVTAATVEEAAENENILEQGSGTEFNGEVVDTQADLQNAETLNRQNPQAVAPVYDLEGVSRETIETFQAVEGKNGSTVVLEDGTVLGELTEMDIDNAGKGEMTIDISETVAVDGDSLVITTGPENVSIADGMIIVASNATEISNLAGGDKGADDGRANVYLN